MIAKTLLEGHSIAKPLLSTEEQQIEEAEEAWYSTRK
jgi:hypothetical protein